MNSSEAGLHEHQNMFLFRKGTAYPTQLQIETTSRCNLKCPNCRRTTDFPDAAESLSEDVLAEFGRLAQQLDNFTISGWGESLMGRSIDALLDLGAKAGIPSSITTNGTLLTESRCKMLIEKRVGTIAVSIDAGTPEGYQRLRPGGVPFDKVVEGVNRLMAMLKETDNPTPKVGLAMVFYDDSADELIPLLKMVRARMPRITLIVLQTLYFSDFDPATKDYRLSPKSIAILKEARELAAKLGLQLQVDLPDQMLLDCGERPARLNGFYSMPTVEEIREKSLVPTCNAAWQNPFIDSEGKVYPCCIYPESFGSLKQNTFEEIWHGEKFREMRLGLHNGNPSEHCRNCRKTFWYENRTHIETPSVVELDTPGFIGLGWYEPEKTRWGTGFRWSREHADIFLKNTGEPYLFIEAAALPEGCNVAISVNDRPVATLLVPRKWQVHTIPIEKYSEDLLRVSFKCFNVKRHPDHDEYWWHRRKLGIAVTRVGLCASPETAPRRNPVTFSEKLMQTAQYKIEKARESIRARIAGKQAVS